MKKIFAMVFAVAVALIAGAAFAAEKKEADPAAVQVPGGQYQIKDDLMIITLDYPLTNNRDTIVGNYVADKAGGVKLNMDSEKDLTETGKFVRDQILSLKTPTGLFALRSCIVQHDAAVVGKYSRREWSEVTPQIVEILKEAAKGKNVKKK